MSAKLLPPNLVFLRRKKQMSQAKFSTEIEVELKRYAKWEEGRCQPDIDNLIAIARSHDVTVDDLLTRNLSEPSN